MEQAWLAAHVPQLGLLAAALVARSALSPQQAATASADARDLPEDVREVRGRGREGGGGVMCGEGGGAAGPCA